MKEPKITYDNGTTTCEVVDHMGRVFKGISICHPDDKDFESPITGGTIAEMRAMIAVSTAYRNDLKVKLSALNQLLYSMKQSSHFNPKSYEAKMLFRQISLLKNDLDIAKHQIAVLKLDLHDYIQDKEILHQRLRKKFDTKKNF